jgi:hypothetical protein
VQRQGKLSEHGTFGRASASNKRSGGGKLNAREKIGFSTFGFASRRSRGSESYARSGGKRNTVERQGRVSGHKAFGQAVATSKRSGGGKLNAREKIGFSTFGIASHSSRGRDNLSSQGGKRNTVQRQGLAGNRTSYRGALSMDRSSSGGKLNSAQRKGFVIGGFSATGGRGRDSFSSRPKSVQSSYAYNEKHKRVQKKWNPFMPKRERESSSFGGRKLKTYKHYVFNAKSKQIKHRRGFIFNIINGIQNRTPKHKKKKDKELNLWDPKMRRHMKGGT